MNERNFLELLHNKYSIYLEKSEDKSSCYLIRMLELEIYTQDDPFTHGNERQMISKGFYVHRSGKSSTSSYKGGTYGGMDLILDGVAYLIRAAQIFDIKNGSYEIVEGPNLVLTTLAKYATPNVITDSLGNVSLGTGLFNPFKYLEDTLGFFEYEWVNTPEIKPIRFGARAGLTLKRSTDLIKWSNYLIMIRHSSIIDNKKYKEVWCYTIENGRIKMNFDSLTKKFQTFWHEGTNCDSITKDMTLHHVLGYYCK